MVLDSSVMNVSISQIVEDLNTTVTGVQSAITMYTLVMAAFMLVGAKLGDILGRDRAFGLGLAVYGLGSLITALSPNLTVLLIGWSGIEGLGAVLVIPAIAALTAANYEGKERAFAYWDDRRRRGRGDRGRPADRRLRDDDLELAVRLRRRGRGGDRGARRPPAHEARAQARASAEAGLRRRRALGRRARPDRVRDPEEQHLGLDQADRRADDQRARDHAVRVLAGAVPDRRRLRRARLLPGVGGAPRAARQEHAPQPRAAEDRDAARRALLALARSS